MNQQQSLFCLFARMSYFVHSRHKPESVEEFVSAGFGVEKKS